ncbi:hypothetical protein CHU98_g9982 [Xylaria longipes]|nr:hypothetical protein CHU98_g9982 [Xylaria longipes]
MHDVYGPVVRINPHEIHVRDSTWIDTLYTGPAHGKRDKYPPTAVMTGVPKSIFGTVSHELHRLRRSAYSSLFSKTNVSTASTMIYDKIDLLINRMDAQVARDGSAAMRLNYLAFATDTVAHYCTGKTRGLLEDEKNALEWHKSIVTLTESTLPGRHFPWIVPLVLQLPMLVVKTLMAKSARFIALHREMEIVAQEIAAYHSRNRKHADTGKSQTVFDLILSNENLSTPEKAPDRISQEAVLCIAAGGETTARSLTTATYYLLTHPDVLSRLQDELMTVMPDVTSRPSLSRLEHLEWLTAIIKESLRVMGLSTTRFPLVSPKEPIRYKDKVIPAGDPLEFRPERWLSSNPELDRLNRSYMPFGRGNRMCIGLNLGTAECGLEYYFYVKLQILLEITYDQSSPEHSDLVMSQRRQTMATAVLEYGPHGTNMGSVSLEQNTRMQLLQRLRGSRVVVPDLQSMIAHWPSSQHPEVERLDEQVDRVLRSIFTLPRDEVRFRKMKESKIAEFATVWWPYAQFEALLTATYMSIFLFIWDDEIDAKEFSSIAADYDAAASFRAQTVAYLKASLSAVPGTDLSSVSTNPIITSFKPVGNAIVKSCDKDQVQGFRDELLFFIRMCEEEQKIFAAPCLPAVEDYMQRRMGSSAVRVFFAITEYACGITLPKEAHSQVVDSLIPLLMVELGSAQAAIEHAEGIIRSSIRRFDLAVERILAQDFRTVGLNIGKV